MSDTLSALPITPPYPIEGAREDAKSALRERGMVMVSGSKCFLDGRVVLHLGNCLDLLDEIDPNSIDSVVCDPPYHLASIVKRFGKDGSAPAKAAGATGVYNRSSAGFMGKSWDGGDIAFRVETWAKVLRVLKPGAYILAFSSSRTFGRMSVAIEDAGFITHPMIGWLFGSGFPKATRIRAEGHDGWRYGGQALKPALEPIYMGQKPFSEANGTANILRWGVGGINIDGCRVAAAFESGWSKSGSKPSGNVAMSGASYAREATPDNSTGRWPANLIHDGSDEVLMDFPETASGGAPTAGDRNGEVFGRFARRSLSNHGASEGSAARFFFAAKADSDDRLGSKHPTVKPLDLMQYLVRLVTPPGGVVLDPFAGTGTTGEAAYREGMRAVLIERETEYQNDIARRMMLVLAGPDERARAAAAARASAVDHGPLFGVPA